MVSHHDIKLKFDNRDFKCYQNTSWNIPLQPRPITTYQLETLEVINF